MQGKREAFVYLVTKVVTAIIGIFSITIQTTYITPDVSGTFSLITGFTGILCVVFVGWIGSSALRYYDSYRKSNLKAFITTVNLNLIIAAIVICTITVVSSFVWRSVPIKDNLLLIITMIIFACGVEVYEKMMRAAGHHIMYCILLILQSVLNISFIVLLFKLAELQLEALFAAKIITSAFFVFVSLWALKVFRNFSISTYSLEMNKVFWAYGVPMIGVWGVSWLLNYADRYIINAFMTNFEVGIYDVAYRFAENSIGVIISAFSLAFFPTMIKCWNEKGKEAICGMMRCIFNYYFMLALPALVGMFLLSNQLYGTIIDLQYKEAAPVIAISSVGFVFMGINNILYKLWQLEEKTKAVLYLTVFSVAVNLITNIIFVPKYGYMAAAITTVVSYVLTTFLTTVSIKRRFIISLDIKTIAKQIVSSLIMGCFVLGFRAKIESIFSLILVIVCAIIIYFISLILLGGLKSDINNILKK